MLYTYSNSMGLGSLHLVARENEHNSPCSNKSLTINSYNHEEKHSYTSDLVRSCHSSNPATYTLTFTIKNTGSETLNIDTITLAAFGYNSSGNAHASTPYANFDLTYTQADESTPITITSSNVGLMSTADVEFSMGDNTITLAQNETCTFDLKVYKSSGSGSFVGLSGATFHSIPEPATATLSVLALVGLAARRRRK